MKFRTEYTPDRQSGFRLNISKPIILLGSCFSTNIGERLTRAGCNTIINPTGTLYNPASIARALLMAIGSISPTLEYNEAVDLWFSQDFSTLFSRKSREDTLSLMNEGISTLAEAISKAGCLIVTLGSSYIYLRHGQVVANCHKLPASEFERRRIPESDIIVLWTDIITQLRNINPDLEIIFTVSPVRHLADGFAGNARSKATLLLACEKLSQLPGCHYFPAFEIVTDDLRDYRFYADDLVHPSAAAVEYIFEKFSDTYISEADRITLRAGEKEFRRRNHRPLIP